MFVSKFVVNFWLKSIYFFWGGGGGGLIISLDKTLIPWLGAWDPVEPFEAALGPSTHRPPLKPTREKSQNVFLKNTGVSKLSGHFYSGS